MIVDDSAAARAEPLPGWDGRFFSSERMTFAYYDIARDAVDLHEHHHEQEEVWHILDGTIAVTVAGVERVVTAGAAVIIPPDTSPSARIIGACRALVADTPRRDTLGSVNIPRLSARARAPQAGER